MQVKEEKERRVLCFDEVFVYRLSIGYKDHVLLITQQLIHHHLAKQFHNAQQKVADGLPGLLQPKIFPLLKSALDVQQSMATAQNQMDKISDGNKLEY